ncbi:hypothetical protein Tco_0370809 [Tanacetum coccineum]
MDDGPSSLKKWKNKFFLIDRRAILDHLTWRHSYSCVSDDLPIDGYDRNDVERLRIHLIRLREMKELVLVRFGLSFVWSNKECDLGDAKIFEEPHHQPDPLLERVLSHTTAPVAEDALISLPTLDEVAAAQPDPRLTRKSKGPSHVRVQSASATASEPSQPTKKRRLKKRASEFGSSAPELGQAEGLNEANITDFCTELEDRMERDEGTSIRTDSVPTPPLTHASTSVAGGFAGKSRAEAMRRQMDPLDALARSALSHDAEYDEIPEDDFGTATRGEEIELTLFPLAPCPYHMSFPYEGVSYPLYTKEEWDGSHAPESNILCKDNFKDPYVCRKALDRTITPAELRRTESLLPLGLSNCVNVLSALLVSHGTELNSRYTDLVASRGHLQEKLDRKTRYVKVLRSEVTSLNNKLEKSQLADARVASAGLTQELAQTDAKLSEQVLIMRDLQNELALERSKSQAYKDAADELRTKVTQFIGSGVEGLVRRLLLSDEFHVALAHVASLGINYGVERGLRMGCTDADFEAAAWKVSNLHLCVQAGSYDHLGCYRSAHC